MRITKQPEERRQEIIDAAAELFRVKGFLRTSVSDIVGSLGVAQGLFYYYFKNKDDVIAAVMESNIRRIEEEIRSIISDVKLSFYSKLAYALLALMKHSRRFASAEPADRSFDDKILHDQTIMKAAARVAVHLDPLLRSGMAQGYAAADFPEDAIRTFLYGIISAERAGGLSDRVMLALAEHTFNIRKAQLVNCLDEK